MDGAEEICWLQQNEVRIILINGFVFSFMYKRYCKEFCITQSSTHLLKILQGKMY